MSEYGGGYLLLRSSDDNIIEEAAIFFLQRARNAGSLVCLGGTLEEIAFAMGYRLVLVEDDEPNEKAG